MLINVRWKGIYIGTYPVLRWSIELPLHSESRETVYAIVQAGAEEFVVFALEGDDFFTGLPGSRIPDAWHDTYFSELARMQKQFSHKSKETT